MAGSESERINITPDEFKRFEDAMKSEHFRKMFVSYANELADPENKRQYEEEIVQMEAEKGRNVTLVLPKPGFVAKLSYNGGGKKVFLNICSSDKIDKSVCRSGKVDEPRGQHWAIPYSVPSPRQDLDKSGKQADVYDAIFHPETIERGLKDIKFRSLMIDSAIDGIESRDKVCLDKKRIRFPKMKYKGTPSTVMLRLDKPQEGGGDISQPGDEVHNGDQLETKLAEMAEAAAVVEEPHYAIVHRGYIDFQDYTTARDVTPGTRPRELVVTIDLPRCESSASVHLDVLEKQLLVESKEQQYSLDLPLPYPVDDSNGKAKFDKSKRRLTVTLPVLPEKKTVEELKGLDESGFAGTCPHYTFQQDDETVTFILHVSHVITDSLTKDISPDKVKVTFRGHTEEGVNESICYSFCVLFPSEHRAVVEESRVEVLCETVVIVVWKETKCQGMWQRFQAGASTALLEERMFLTSENVAEAVKQMEEHANDPWKTNDSQSFTCSVSEMTDKCVTVQIDPTDQVANTEMEDNVASGETQADVTASVLPMDTSAKGPVVQTSGDSVSRCWPGLEEECNARTDSCGIEDNETEDVKSEETVRDLQATETKADIGQGSERSVENEESEHVSDVPREQEIINEQEKEDADSTPAVHTHIKLSSSLMFDLD